jgi:hypothetical protein
MLHSFSRPFQNVYPALPVLEASGLFWYRGRMSGPQNNHERFRSGCFAARAVLTFSCVKRALKPQLSQDARCMYMIPNPLIMSNEFQSQAFGRFRAFPSHVMLFYKLFKECFMTRIITLLLALSLLSWPFYAHATPSSEEDAAIQHLIGFVRDSGLEFIRNGDAHASSEAAEHLLMKYNNTKKRLSAADEFIDHVASKSSMSGKPYFIRKKDGTEIPVSEWLHAELKAYRMGLAKPIIGR